MRTRQSLLIITFRTLNSLVEVRIIRIAYGSVHLVRAVPAIVFSNLRANPLPISVFQTSGTILIRSISKCSSNIHQKHRNHTNKSDQSLHALFLPFRRLVMFVSAFRNPLVSPLLSFSWPSTYLNNLHIKKRDKDIFSDHSSLY